MKASFSIAVIATLLASSGTSAMEATPADTSAGPVVEMGDIDRFYRVYDAADGRPTAETLQRDYIDPGSEGLHVLGRLRNVNGESIAQAIAKRPEIYSAARDCVSVLPRVRTRLTGALRELRDLYPEARFPPITIAIGRGRSAGVGGRETGVQIGAETLCATAWIEPDIEDRFVRVITHEFAHVQQAVAFSELENATVLSASLEEGAAEFVTELTTGSVAYSYMPRLTAGRESEIETAFAADIDKTDLSAWLYNSKPDAPADLGYWVGYRIVKSYYHHADDKRQALRDIFAMTDPKAFLAKSGWKPGIALD